MNQSTGTELKYSWVNRLHQNNNYESMSISKGTHAFEIAFSIKNNINDKTFEILESEVDRLMDYFQTQDPNNTLISIAPKNELFSIVPLVNQTNFKTPANESGNFDTLIVTDYTKANLHVLKLMKTFYSSRRKKYRNVNELFRIYVVPMFDLITTVHTQLFNFLEKWNDLSFSGLNSLVTIDKLVSTLFELYKFQGLSIQYAADKMYYLNRPTYRFLLVFSMFDKAYFFAIEVITVISMCLYNLQTLVGDVTQGNLNSKKCITQVEKHSIYNTLLMTQITNKDSKDNFSEELQGLVYFVQSSKLHINTSRYDLKSNTYMTEYIYYIFKTSSLCTVIAADLWYLYRLRRSQMVLGDVAWLLFSTIVQHKSHLYTISKIGNLSNKFIKNSIYEPNEIEIQLVDKYINDFITMNLDRYKFNHSYSFQRFLFAESLRFEKEMFIFIDWYLDNKISSIEYFKYYSIMKNTNYALYCPDYEKFRYITHKTTEYEIVYTSLLSKYNVSFKNNNKSLRESFKQIEDKNKDYLISMKQQIEQEYNNKLQQELSKRDKIITDLVNSYKELQKQVALNKKH